MMKENKGLSISEWESLRETWKEIRKGLEGEEKVESNVFLLSLKCLRNKHGSQNSLVFLKRVCNSKVDMGAGK